jgi:NADH:ubiquinone oxidoreductase subunit 3 (subunit A)
MAQKSKIYFTTRSIIRGLVKVLLLLAAYVIIHLATYSFWTVLFFMAIVTAGFVIYDHKTKQVTSVED